MKTIRNNKKLMKKRTNLIEKEMYGIHIELEGKRFQEGYVICHNLLVFKIKAICDN